MAYCPRGVGPPPGHGLCPEWRVFFFQTRENRTNTQPFTELEPIWFAYVSGSTIRSAHDDRNIRGTPLVHVYGWQLKDDMYLVGGNGSCAMVWCSVIVSGQVNQQCSCQTTVFDIHCKPRGWRPSTCTASIKPLATHRHLEDLLTRAFFPFKPDGLRSESISFRRRPLRTYGP